jgi:hypothetical protein
VDITVRSATLVRSALAGAVVCLVAVGVTAPALAGSGDDPEPCPDAGPVEALLNGEDCGEDAPAPVLAPGSLLDPQFPDFPDFPGLPDDDSDEQDDESGSDDDGDEGDESEAADEDADSDSDTESDTESGTGSDEDSDETDSDKTDSDEADSSADEDAEPAVFTDEPAARDSGADAAVGAAVLPGVGDAIDGADSPGLDWTGALAPGGPSGPDSPRDPPAPVQRVDPPAPRTYLAAPLAPPPAPAHAAEPAAVAFATALPSPVDARWDLGSVLPSLALTLLLLGALALPVGPLNRAAAEHPERVEALLARLRVPPGTGRPAPVAFLTAVGVTAVAGAVLLGFLTPEFPFDTSAPALLVGLAVAFVVVTAAQQGTQLLYVTRWWGVRCHLGPVPGFLLIGAVGVVLSRAVGLEPGLVLGTLVAFRTARPLRTDEEGPAVALAATALTAVGGTAWVVRDPLVAAVGAPGTFLADAVATALTVTAVSAAANLVFALVPLSFLPGAALLRWSPALWALFACTSGFAFVHLVVPPAVDALAGQAGVLAVVLGVYLVTAGALWAWLRHGADLNTGRLSVVPRR